MSVATKVRTRYDDKLQTDKRLELVRRFTLAGFEDTSIFETIPNDVHLFLLPDDDKEFVEHELRIGARAARRGDNVYFKHIRTADLPE